MRPTVILVLALLWGAAAACSSDDDAAGPRNAPVDERDEQGRATLRFCDAYLEYLADPSDATLETVAEVADDETVEELAGIVATADDPGRVIAADEDLDSLARQRCQPEWTAGAQGAGSTPAAAQAFFDALVAGDRTGARNVASANAIAAFDPWEPIEPDPSVRSPALVEVGDQTFSIVLDADSLAQCRVETGVVIFCTVAE